MNFHNISRHIFADIAMAPVAAGTGDTQNGLIIDTLGYESILFAVYIGPIVAGGSAVIQPQYGTLANGSDQANLPAPGVAESYNVIPSTAVNVPQTGQNQGWLSVEIHRPTKRYVRITVQRVAQNVTINGAVVLMARGAFLPPAQGVTMGNVTPPVIVSP